MAEPRLAVCIEVSPGEWQPLARPLDEDEAVIVIKKSTERKLKGIMPEAFGREYDKILQRLIWWWHK